jgi:hypothetical protein
VVSFTFWPLYPQEKSPSYPLDRRLSGSQRRSGRVGEEKNSQPPSESKPRTPIVQPVALSLYQLSYHGSALVGYQRCRGPCCLHLQGEVNFSLPTEVPVAIYEIFTTVKIQPVDGGSNDLRSIGILPQHYTASQPRRR